MDGLSPECQAAIAETRAQIAELRADGHGDLADQLERDLAEAHRVYEASRAGTPDLSPDDRAFYAHLESMWAAGMSPEEISAQVEREADAEYERQMEEIRRTNRRLKQRERRHARAGERWFRREVRNQIQQRRRAARPVSCVRFRREPGAQPVRRVGSRRATGTSASSTDPPESDSSRLTPLLLGRAGR